jgi:hypothetical protein
MNIGSKGEQLHDKILSKQEKMTSFGYAVKEFNLFSLFMSIEKNHFFGHGLHSDNNFETIPVKLVRIIFTGLNFLKSNC